MKYWIPILFMTLGLNSISQAFEFSATEANYCRKFYRGSLNTNDHLLRIFNERFDPTFQQEFNRKVIYQARRPLTNELLNVMKGATAEDWLKTVVQLHVGINELLIRMESASSKGSAPDTAMTNALNKLRASVLIATAEYAKAIGQNVIWMNALDPSPNITDKTYAEPALLILPKGVSERDAIKYVLSETVTIVQWSSPFNRNVFDPATNIRSASAITLNKPLRYENSAVLNDVRSSTPKETEFDLSEIQQIHHEAVEKFMDDIEAERDFIHSDKPHTVH